MMSLLTFTRFLRSRQGILLVALLLIVPGCAWSQHKLDRGWAESQPEEALRFFTARTDTLSPQEQYLLATAYWRHPTLPIDSALHYIETLQESPYYGSILRIKSAILFGGGRYQDAERSLDKLLRVAHPDSLDLRAYAYYLKGFVNYQQGNEIEALKWYTIGLDVAKDAGSYYEGVIYGRLAIFFENHNDLFRASTYGYQALKIAQRHNKTLSIASSANNLGAVYLKMDSLNRALPLFEQAFRGYHEVGYLWWEVQSATNILTTAFDLKDTTAFLRAYTFLKPYLDQPQYRELTENTDLILATCALQAHQAPSYLALLNFLELGKRSTLSFAHHTFSKYLKNSSLTTATQLEILDKQIALYNLTRQPKQLDSAYAAKHELLQIQSALLAKSESTLHRDIANFIASEDDNLLRRETSFVQELEETYAAELFLYQLRLTALILIILTLIAFLVIFFKQQRQKKHHELKSISEIKDVNKWLQGFFPKAHPDLRKLCEAHGHDALDHVVLININVDGVHKIPTTTHPAQWLRNMDLLYSGWDVVFQKHNFLKIGAGSSNLSYLLLPQNEYDLGIQVKALYKDICVHFDQAQAQLFTEDLVFNMMIHRDMVNVLWSGTITNVAHVASDAIHEMESIQHETKSGLILSTTVVNYFPPIPDCAIKVYDPNSPASVDNPNKKLRGHFMTHGVAREMFKTIL